MHFRYVKIKLVEILPLSSYHPYILQKNLYTLLCLAVFAMHKALDVIYVFNAMYVNNIIYYTSVTLLCTYSTSRICVMITLILASLLWSAIDQNAGWQVNAMFSRQCQHATHCNMATRHLNQKKTSLALVTIYGGVKTRYRTAHISVLCMRSTYERQLVSSMKHTNANVTLAGYMHCAAQASLGLHVFTQRRRRRGNSEILCRAEGIASRRCVVVYALLLPSSSSSWLLPQPYWFWYLEQVSNTNFRFRKVLDSV